MINIDLFSRTESGSPSTDLIESFNKLVEADLDSKHSPLSFATSQTIKLVSANIGDIALAQGLKVFDVWERLLEDSLLYLKINDYREKAFLALKDLEAKRRKDEYPEDFRKHHLYGLNDLIKYIEEFKNFEGILYGADKNYRDHLFHPVNVWLIGMVILGDFGLRMELITGGSSRFQIRDLPHFMVEPNAPACRECKFCEDLDVPSQKKAIVSTAPKENPCFALSLGELGAMWTIVALTHDLGYPLEKVHSVNDAIQRMLSHFAKGGGARADFSFQTQHIQLIRSLNRIISGKIEKNPIFRLGEKGITGEMPQGAYIQIPHKKWRAKVRAKYFSKFANAWQHLEHGILSAYILLRKLTFFMEADYAVDEHSDLDPEDARQLVIRSEMLLAIASHTNYKIYHLNPWTLSFLLVLCDELQEWSRPNYSELGFRPVDRIKNIRLSLSDPHGIESGKAINIEITYDYGEGLTGEEFKTLFDKRWQPWNERLRPGVDDDKRNIRLILNVISEEKRAQYVNDPFRHVWEQVSVDSSQNHA